MSEGEVMSRRTPAAAGAVKAVDNQHLFQKTAAVAHAINVGEFALIRQRGVIHCAEAEVDILVEQLAEGKGLRRSAEGFFIAQQAPQRIVKTEIQPVTGQIRFIVGQPGKLHSPGVGLLEINQLRRDRRHVVRFDGGDGNPCGIGVGAGVFSEDHHHIIAVGQGGGIPVIVAGNVIGHLVDMAGSGGLVLEIDCVHVIVVGLDIELEAHSAVGRLIDHGAAVGAEDFVADLVSAVIAPGERAGGRGVRLVDLHHNIHLTAEFITREHAVGIVQVKLHVADDRGPGIVQRGQAAVGKHAVFFGAGIAVGQVHVAQSAEDGAQDGLRGKHRIADRQRRIGEDVHVGDIIHPYVGIGAHR